MKDSVKQERKREKVLQQRILKWTKTAESIPRDELFLYRFIKKTKISQQEAITFLNSISIKVTNEMITARKKKLKELRLRRKERKMKKKMVNAYEIPDIPWLDDEWDDARYQNELIWMQMHPQLDSSDEINSSCIYPTIDDDLPF